MTHDVFISYSSKDKPTADAACATLEGRGIRCWIAPRDITPGADWGETIIDAINGSRAFLVILSANANTSQQIKREVERAVHNGLPIIPMRIEDVKPAKALEYFLSTPHWLDAMTPPLEHHLNRLAEVMRSVLDGVAPPAGSATPKTPTSLPPWLMDRRVLIGGGAAVLSAAAIGAWMGVTGARPGSFVGKWKAEKMTLSAGTLQSNAIGFATDVFVQASLKGDAITGSFEVDDLGQYRYQVMSEDAGSVLATSSNVTFTSNVTKEATTFGYYLIGEEMAQGMVSAYGGQPGDHGLVLNPPPRWVQASLVGKPRSSVGPAIEKIAADWRFKSQVNGMVATPQVTLSIGADGRYKFLAHLDERGLWTAADGKWTRTPQGAFQAINGTYAFDGGDRVTWGAANGSTVWVRD